MLKGEKEISDGANKVLSTNLNEVENTLISVMDLKKKLKSSN